ncbi:MAG: hypothetical protein HDT16_07185 [Oscillibacter sp.]|nr:hypothetical protein [Oscillibacter sp.]
MSEKRKTRPRYSQYQGRAVETGAASRQATTSTKNDTTSPPGGQIFHIADLLLIGEENALPMKHLRSVTDLSSREIRAMIQQERLDGVPICANNLTGYYLAADNVERQRFVNSMRHRSAEIARVADAVERAEV